MDKQLLISNILRLLPDIKITETYLRNDPENFVAQFISHEKIARVADPALESLESSISTPPLSIKHLQTHILNILEIGQHACEKVEQHGYAADLSLEELEGLEAITDVTRPTLCITEGRFDRPPREWLILEEIRSPIETICQSVGRIEISGHPKLDYAGTGFLIADDIVMTNRHVAEIFCDFEQTPSLFKTGIRPSIDYLREAYNPLSLEFELCNLIGVHEYYDLALFRIEPHMNMGITIPRPLVLAEQSDCIEEDNRVYIIGYPKWRGDTYRISTIQTIFAGPQGVKRLQPGRILSVIETDRVFIHDCSTLSGNSGSCLLDIQTHKVLGIHFRGEAFQENHAIALWMLKSDPFLRKAGVYFA